MDGTPLIYCKTNGSHQARGRSNSSEIAQKTRETDSNLLCSTSKLSASNASARGSAKKLLAGANGEKKRNFAKTIELQISLKEHDLQRDKRFSGTAKYVDDSLRFGTRVNLVTQAPPQCPPSSRVHLHSSRCSRYRSCQAGSNLNTRLSMVLKGASLNATHWPNF